MPREAEVPSESPASRGAGRLGAFLGLALVLGAYAVSLWFYFVPVLGGPDGNSYHVAARMLEQHGRLHRVQDDDFQFAGRMWVQNERGELYSKYPPLYPATAGFAMKVFGDLGGLGINPLCGLLTVLGVFVLARALVPPWAALLAAWAAATNPVLAALAVDQISEASAVCLVTWGYALFFHGVRDEERLRPGLLFGAGLLLGASAGVRYTNVLMALPVVLWFALRLRRRPWSAAAACALGLAIPYLALAWYHAHAFGHPLRTGYALTAEDRAFTLTSFVHNLRFYLPAVMTDGFGPLFVLAVCGFVTRWARNWKEGAFYTLWIVPAALLYMSYYFLPETHPLSYVRFLLPLGVPCLVLALVFARDAVSRIPGRAAAAAVVAGLFLCQGAWGLAASVDAFEKRYVYNDVQHRKVEFIRDTVPEGAVVFGPFWILDALDYYQEYALYDFELLDRETLTAQIGHFMRDRHVQHERKIVWKEELVDVDEAAYLARARELLDGLLASGRELYLVGNPRAQEGFASTFAEHYSTERVAGLPQLRPRHRLFLGSWPTPGTPAYWPIDVVRVRQRPVE